MNRIVVTLATLALAFLPTAAADHGLEVVGVGTLDDDSAIAYFGQYVNGTGDRQTWDFTVVVGGTSIACRGFGSIEVGFVCQNGFSTGATGHPHVYPLWQPDPHVVSVSYGGVSGTAAQTTTMDEPRL